MKESLVIADMKNMEVKIMTTNEFITKIK